MPLRHDDNPVWGGVATVSRIDDYNPVWGGTVSRIDGYNPVWGGYGQ